MICINRDQFLNRYKMSPITEFYKGKTVFVTGATGFMGKVLLEKLVRSLPDIKKIYILMRFKKGCAPQERIKQLTENTIFTFHNMTQKAYEKIEAISGDITKEDFDMSESDKEKLINEVSVVFHLAASVRMDLPLKEAVITNTKSTHQLFKFCMNIKELKSVVHLSTAFCNVEIKNMEEKVYPMDVDPYKIIDMVEWMDDKSLSKITKKILGSHPNTYTFTKRLAELIAIDMGDKIPIIITRPSIVVPSLCEPTPGWVDNFNGPLGLFTAAGTGVLKVCLMDQDSVPETIPVDFAINTIICSGYERANTTYAITPTINLTSGRKYPYTWREIIEAYTEQGLKYPFKHVLWHPGAYVTKSYYVFLICSFLFQIIPALIIDFLLIMFLQKPFLINIQKRILQTFQTLQDFIVKKWTFANGNCIKLEEKLNKADKEVFYGIMSKSIDLKEYAFHTQQITKKYLVKDNSENYEFYRFRGKILYLLDRFVKFYFVYLILKWSFLCLNNWLIPITEFYAGKTVFITGATGYMGKVLLEKLVRSLPDIKKIYILIRPKKGCTPQERVKQLTDGLIFTFHNMNQRAYDKIEAISGDITKENFDMSEIDKKKLIEEVSIVFHVAASVRMDLSLKEAVITNTKSTYQLFKFCMNIKELKSVVHLSTAFCNVEVSYMEEKVYPLNVDPYKIMDLVEWMDDKSLACITKNITSPHPNTYTFTKRLSEIIAKDMGDKLPIVITRPSIVVPALYEPIAGWVDNFYGPIGLLIAAGKGVLKTALVDRNLSPQVIPVDIAINGLILAGYERSKQKHSETPTFNLTQGNLYDMSWGEVFDVLLHYAHKYPFKTILWYPRYSVTTNYNLNVLLTYIFHFIPAYFIDFLLIIFLQKPFLVNIQKRIFAASKVLYHFAVKKWEFSIDNLTKSTKELTNEDKEKFYSIDLVNIDVQKYLREGYFSARKYLIKDYDENLDIYRIRNKILFVVDAFLKILFLYWIINLFLSLIR
ncbi:fatty acyl-CoA reductase 2-like [Onthophagus taurus]|uniref:fatty acyl-CoA reductase 2-like n=1 Tax=Onthophagus taurus TaxID=166361 RepID=UPI0039BE88FF